LTGIHERAVISLKLLGQPRVLIQQAEGFFFEATCLISADKRTAQSNRNEADSPKKAENSRTMELTGTGRQLLRDLPRGQYTDAVLKNRRLDWTKLLAQSLPKQVELRRLTYGILRAQEAERQTISHQLQDEVLQTLVGIQVGLVNLRTSAKGNLANFTKEVARLQQLVEESIDVINRFARELENPNPAPNNLS